MNKKQIFFNYADKVAIKALRFLAENDRPEYGCQEFNAEHLYQIARELEISVNNVKELERENAALKKNNRKIIK